MLQSPAFLALTWIVWWGASVGLGWLVTRGRVRPIASLGWLGLFSLTAISMLVGLLVPLGSPLARVVALLVLVAGLTAFAWTHWWKRWRLVLVIATIAGLAALLSSVAPSNYDLGLYHAGSIAYVREGGTVIGLANLHDRFGFSSSMWPLSAFLGLGMWDGGEYRLVNGLLLILGFADVLTRIRAGRSRQPATLVLTAGMVLLAGAVIQYPGRLIASSAQDWAVAALMVVSAAYLLDVLMRSGPRVSTTVAILVGAMAGAMRPTGWIYAIATVAVLLVFHARASGWRAALGSVIPGVGGALLLGALTLVRDVLTSGWLLFPAGFAPVPVGWRYPDPTETSQNITAWARTPFQDPAQTLADNSWITGWLGRLPTDWAAFTAVVLLAILVVWVVASATARRALVVQWRVLALALAPSVTVLVVWLVSAPDPRFAWGPLLLIALVPTAVLVPTIRRTWIWPTLIAVASTAIVAVAIARGSLVEISLRLEPMPNAQVENSSLEDGTPVVIPVNGDQCWSEFPLCRPWYASTEVKQRGVTWKSGFQPISRLSDNQE